MRIAVEAAVEVSSPTATKPAVQPPSRAPKVPTPLAGTVDATIAALEPRTVRTSGSSTPSASRIRWKVTK